jgi:hypothetical protein
MFRSRHARHDADVNRFSQGAPPVREMREPAHVDPKTGVSRM